MSVFFLRDLEVWKTLNDRGIPVPVALSVKSSYSYLYLCVTFLSWFVAVLSLSQYHVLVFPFSLH